MCFNSVEWFLYSYYPRSKRVCVQKCLLGLIRGFLAGYVTKSVVNGMLAAIFKRNPKELLKAFAGWDSARLGAFLGGFVSLHSGCHCALSHARGVDDRLNAAISGTVTFISISLSGSRAPPGSRKNVSARVSFGGHARTL